MLALTMLAGALAAPPDLGLAEARHAIEVGRIDQARVMVAAAIASGAKGDPVDRILADLAFAGGDNTTALARYATLAQQHPSEGMLMERAGIAAAMVGNTAYARAYGERAASLPGASWRTWNLLGALADLERDFASADAHYSRAIELAPEQSEVLNNIGWSHLLRGGWSEAVPSLQRAAELKPESRRIANNLQLAVAALSENLPVRGPHETDIAWAARLNDAGVAAQMRGENKRAIAAFAQALEVRQVWYERAANNLTRAETSQ